MSIRITDREMDSDITSHRAWWSPGAAADGNGAWQVSWTPGRRLLTREQADMAMRLAELVATCVPADDPVSWASAQIWARELWLTAEDAIQRIRDTH